MPNKLPTLPRHSRWTILGEVLPAPKRQIDRSFTVQCSCEPKTIKTLAWRYVAGESLSCGCLQRERAVEIGRENITAVNRSGRKYSPTAKLPSADELRTLRESLTVAQIAKQFGAARQSVLKKLKNNP